MILWRVSFEKYFVLSTVPLCLWFLILRFLFLFRGIFLFLKWCFRDVIKGRSFLNRRRCLLSITVWIHIGIYIINLKCLFVVFLNLILYMILILLVWLRILIHIFREGMNFFFIDITILMKLRVIPYLIVTHQIIWQVKLLD